MVSRESFYGTGWVAQSIVDQCHHRYVTIRFPYGLRRHYNAAEKNLLNGQGVVLLNPIDNPFIEIHDPLGMGPTSLLHFVMQGAMEFIPEVSTVFDLSRTDTVIIDLDPKGPFTWDHVKQATMLTHDALCRPDSVLNAVAPVKATKFRYSGNRSFHIYIRLDRLYPFEVLRDAVKKSLHPLIVANPGTLTYSAKDSEHKLLIDIGALSRHRCVRSLYSLHGKTGRSCVPVYDVGKFDISWAERAAVLTRGLEQEAF